MTPLTLFAIIVAMLASVFFAVSDDGSLSKNDPDTINLPEPRLASNVSLEEAIFNRRSVRTFSSKSLTLEKLSQLAWAAQGITDKERGLRSAPSAGALYPMELYFLTPDGVFHYISDSHSFTKVSNKDIRKDVQSAALGQTSIGDAPCIIAITALPTRTTSKYSDRGYRYIYMEAGHIAQNIHLQAVALGLVSVPVGAFSDTDVRRILPLKESQVPVYLIPVGHQQ